MKHYLRRIIILATVLVSMFLLASDKPIKDIVNTLQDTLDEVQGNIDTSADNYFKSLTFDEKGALIATRYSLSPPQQLSLNNVKARIERAKKEAKIALDL